MSNEFLPYEIVYCTSEDDKHRVTELAGRSKESLTPDENMVGWHSIPNGKVPQTLVFRFPGNVWLQQIRIRCHETKIPSKMEVRTFSLRDRDALLDPPSFRSVRFTKLGSVEFSQHEPDQPRVRECKTVHIKVETYFVKLLFSHSHASSLNPTHQVGVYSIECSGHLLSAVRFHVDRPIGRRLSSCQSSPRQSFRIAKDGTANPSCPPRQLQPVTEKNGLIRDHYERSHSSTVPNATCTTADLNGTTRPAAGQMYPMCDFAGTSPTIRSQCETDKYTGEGGRPSPFRSVRIIEFENFFIHRSEELLALKEQAVAVEDFGIASKCRDRLNRLNKRSARIYHLEQDKVQAIIEEDFDAAKRAKEEMDRLVKKVYEEIQIPEPRADFNPEECEPDSPSLPTVPHRDGAESRHGGPACLEQSLPSKHTPHANDGMQDRNETDHVGGAEVNTATTSPSYLEKPHGDGEGEDVIKVNDLDDWERPVAQSLYQSAGGETEHPERQRNIGFDVRELTAAVGVFTTACLFSRRFKLREAAIITATDRMDDLYTESPAVIETALLRYLDYNSYGLQDTIPNVVYAACTLVRMALSDEFNCLRAVCGPLQALLPRLLTRAADPLPRIRDEAMTTLTLYVRTSGVSNSAFLNAILAEPVDRERRKVPSTNPRAQLARLMGLQLLVEGDPGVLEGHSEQTLNKLLLGCLNHQSSEVRELATSILCAMLNAHCIHLKANHLAQINNAAIKDVVRQTMESSGTP